MKIEFMLLLQALVLVIALSVDAFIASFAYGADKIKIPFPSVCVITLICSVTLCFSLFIGGLIAPYLPHNVTRIACFVILFVLGIVKLFDSTLKAFIKKYQSKNKKLSFTLFQIKFILQIFVDSKAADKDLSRRLSPAEAASLAIALSLDGLGVGFGAGLAQIGLLEVLIASIVTTLLCVIIGAKIGAKVASVLKHDISWIGGVLLMFLAFAKLV